MRWFGFKSAGTNPWHEVILCWSSSLKFIHQLFTAIADCINVGNYKGWVFSLRQKECDTVDTPNLMWATPCPSGVQGRNYLCIRKQCASAKEKRQTHYFKPFITHINFSAEINKGCWACLEDRCSLPFLASFEQGLLGCHAYWPLVKPLHFFLIIHLEQGDWRTCQGELLACWRMDILWEGSERGRQGHVFFFCVCVGGWGETEIHWCLNFQRSRVEK